MWQHKTNILITNSTIPFADKGRSHFLPTLYLFNDFYPNHFK